MPEDLNLYGSIFAEVYNLYWTEFVDIIEPQVVKYVENNVRKNKIQILDLCCGTGRLTKKLLDRGYLVDGIDISPDMIKIAQRKCKTYIKDGKANFQVIDATKLKGEENYHLIISTFDSLNHLDGYEELGETFQNVLDGLLPGGLFMFDLNTAKGLKKWEFVDYEETEEAVFIMHGEYDYNKNQAYTKVTGFQNISTPNAKKGSDNCWKKFEELFTNYMFKMDKVEKLLQQTGFESIKFTKATDITEELDQPEEELRVFIICKKPNE